MHICRYSPSQEQSDNQTSLSVLGLLSAAGGLAALGYTQQSQWVSVAYAESAVPQNSSPEVPQVLNSPQVNSWGPSLCRDGALWWVLC